VSEKGVRMKRVCLFGGTFDPPHIGHLHIAEKVLEMLDLDEVWFIPTYHPPHKDKAETASHHRLQMVSLMIEGQERFRVEAIELERKGKSYTIDTIAQLKRKYPNTEFYFLIGGDQVQELSTWKRFDELVDIVQFIGVERPGYQWKDAPYVKKLSIPLIDVSSTEIRQRIKTGRPFCHLLHEKVFHYIKENGLYGYRKSD